MLNQNYVDPGMQFQPVLNNGCPNNWNMQQQPYMQSYVNADTQQIYPVFNMQGEIYNQNQTVQTVVPDWVDVTKPPPTWNRHQSTDHVQQNSQPISYNQNESHTHNTPDSNEKKAPNLYNSDKKPPTSAKVEGPTNQTSQCPTNHSKRSPNPGNHHTKVFKRNSSSGSNLSNHHDNSTYLTGDADRYVDFGIQIQPIIKLYL